MTDSPGDLDALPNSANARALARWTDGAAASRGFGTHSRRAAEMLREYVP